MKAVPIPTANLEVVRQNRFGLDDDDDEYISDKQIEKDWPEDLDENLGATEEEWEWLQSQVPIMAAKHICCAQTHKLMKCPAMVTTTKKTYERDFVFDWVAKNGTDPLKLDPVDPNEIVPNKAVWKIIRKFVKETRKEKKEKEQGGGGGNNNTNGAADSKTTPTSSGNDKAEDYKNEQAARERELRAAKSAKRNQLKKAAEEMEAVEAKMRNQMKSLRAEMRASRALRQSQRKSRKKLRESQRATGPTGEMKADDGGGGAAMGYLMRSAGGGGLHDDDGHFEGDEIYR